jgi:hypothetical protein
MPVPLVALVDHVGVAAPLNGVEALLGELTEDALDVE